MNQAELTNLILSSIPEFAFALILFYLCQRNADKQREAYQNQLDKLYGMLEQMLGSVSRSLDLAERKMSKSD